MKEFIPVPKNKVYCNILFLIADGKNYAQVLARELDKRPQLVIRQLSILEKKGYVSSERVKLLNKKLYAVKWGKIIEELIKHILGKVEESNSKFKGESCSVDDIIFNRHVPCEEIQSYFKNILSQPSKRIIKNKYLLEIFPYVFQQVYNGFIKKGVEITIEEVFDEFIDNLKEDGIYSCVWEWLKKDTLPKNKILHKKLNDLVRRDKGIEEIHYLGLLSKCVNSPLRSIIVEEFGGLSNQIIKEKIDKNWKFL